MFWTQQSAGKRTRALLFVFLLLAFIGFADATYLTAEHYLGKVPQCTVAGCETVLTSQFSTVFGVPVALFGALYYLVLFIGAVYVLDTKRFDLFRKFGALTVLGFVASAYFVYLQVFVIHALCLYCLVSATTSTLMFILWVISKRNK